jgi:hypothetical protein
VRSFSVITFVLTLELLACSALGQPAFTLPIFPIGVPDVTPRPQLRTAQGECWEATYSAAGVKTQATDVFRDTPE